MSGDNDSRKSMDDVLSSIRKIMRGGSATLEAVPPAGSQAEGGPPADTGEEWAIPPGAVSDEEKELAEVVSGAGAEPAAEAADEPEAAGKPEAADEAEAAGEIEFDADDTAEAGDEAGDEAEAGDDDEDDDEDVLALGPAMQAPAALAHAGAEPGAEDPADTWDEHFGAGPEARIKTDAPGDGASGPDEDDDYIPPPPPHGAQIGLSAIAGVFALGTGRTPPPEPEAEVEDAVRPDASPAPDEAIAEPEAGAGPAPDALERMVRQIIQEELQGEIGTRLSQNIRRLIREEVAHAMLRSG
jgi:hypothetical protein